MTHSPDKPDYEIRFEDREGYLYAYVSGEEDSLAVSLDYWERVITECEKRVVRALLLEEDFPNQSSAIDMYTVTRAIASMAPGSLRIAFIDRESDHAELNAFGETVAVNRGLHGRIFRDVADAEAWLRTY